jgi:lipopolysaccharide transport system permease protein
VFVRDVTHGMIIFSNLMFFLTPVFYDIGRLPKGLKSLMYLNPMATIVMDARGTLMSGKMPDWPALLVETVVAFLVMQLGFAWFMKTKKWFADVI